MRKIIHLALICILVSCTQTLPQNINRTVTQFPIDTMLTSSVVRVPPIIMAPTFMFITGNHLVIQNNKKDTLFDIFSFPGLQYQFSAGTRGKGPEEFPDLDRRYPTITPNGFAVFFIDYKTYCEIGIDDINKTLFRIKEQRFQFDDNDDIINGFMPLKQNEFIYFSDYGNAMEYKKLNTSTTEIVSFCPYPTWAGKEGEAMYAKSSLYLNATTPKPDGKKFAAFFSNFKRWRLFNDNGILLRDVSVEVPPFTVGWPKEEERYIYYHFPLSTDNYIFIFCLNAQETNPKNVAPELQIWDWNGNPVAVCHLDQWLTCFAVDEKAKTLFGVNNNEGSEGKIFKYSLPFLE